MDARRNNVYAGFYENAKPVMPEAHLSFAEVVEQVKDAEQVTFCRRSWSLCGADPRTATTS